MIIILALNWLGYNLGMTIQRVMLAITQTLTYAYGPGDKPNYMMATPLGDHAAARIALGYDPDARCPTCWERYGTTVRHQPDDDYDTAMTVARHAGICPCGYITECATYCGNGHDTGDCPPHGHTRHWRQHPGTDTPYAEDIPWEHGLSNLPGPVPSTLLS